MSIKLIALDLDGTLLNEAKEITAPVQEALLYAAARGVHIAVSYTHLDVYKRQEFYINLITNYI